MFQFPEHGFYGLQDRILLFRHDAMDSNILKLISHQGEVNEGTLVEVVLSGKFKFFYNCCIVILITVVTVLSLAVCGYEMVFHGVQHFLFFQLRL